MVTHCISVTGTQIKITCKFQVPTLIPMILILFSLVLMISPALTSVGKYRSSFTVTVILLAVLTPISIVSTLPSLQNSQNYLFRTSGENLPFINMISHSYLTFSPHIT